MVVRTIQKKFLFVLIINILFASSFVLTAAKHASAAGVELLFSPSSGSFEAGKEFSVKVMIDPAGTKVNVGEATINFDKKLLSVVKVSKEGSAFSLWPKEPDFSNTAGTVTFSGGTPTPFANKSAILTITFKALAVGNAEISFSNGSVLAADGKGTDVLSRGLGAAFTIKEAAAAAPTQPPAKPQPPPQKTAPISGNKPEAPEITSSTHEKSDKWYSNSEAQFSWSLPTDIISVATLISQKKDVSPDEIKEVHTPPINTEKVKVKDGEWYFYVQFKNKFGWGKVGSKKILVDTEPPLEFDIQLLSEGVNASAPKLSFETKDELSGIKYYEVSIGDIASETVYPQNLVNGLYPIPPNPGGSMPVKVKAVDKAGNEREVSKNLLIPYVPKPAAEGEGAVKKKPFWTTERIIIFLLVFLVGVLFTLNIRQKKYFRKEIKHVLRESEEAKEKTDKIFSAIREELEEQVQAMDKKPQLTPSERDLLEKMKEVLDLSEELIDTEIEDIRKISRDNL